MLGPWKDDEEVLECMMYWQKRALKAEKEVEECLDYEEFLLNEFVKQQEENIDLDEYNHFLMEDRDELRKMVRYYKQQFLDKDEEIRFILGDSGTEDSDDPWKYRS